MSRGVVSTRSKFRSSQDSCGDCGSLDPGWASINRGILICDECCSVHRSLGRHTSQVKSLRKGPWHPSLLSMVQNLNNSGANNIWEYQLLDPSIVKGMRRKPQQKDPVHPTKADFIRAKHQMLSFVHKSMRDEGFSLSEKDVSKQMHASVRTPNLETTLRLLALGADPNYLHSDKGNCPLHVAARAGQAAQVELLVVYGADPAACDNEGRCPIDYAREGGFSDIVDRLMEFQYELTDRLTFYLCGRGPSHSTGQHFVIPEMADAVDVSMFAKEAKEKLVSLPNHLFEELSCDVFDEVDRRETDSIWLSLQNQSALLSDRCSVPFLPVNPEFSATRNQGRQKLARFNAREFATLIIDILQEAKSRMSSSPNSTLRDISNVTVTPTHKVTNKTNHITDGLLLSPHRQISYPSQRVSPQLAPSHSHLSMPIYSSDNGDNMGNQRGSNLSTCYSAVSMTHMNASSKTKTSNIIGVKSATNPSLKQHNSNFNTSDVNDDEPLYDSVASEDDYSSLERKKRIQTQLSLMENEKPQQPLLDDEDYQEVVDSPNSSFSQSTEVENPTVSIEEYLCMKQQLELCKSRIKDLQESTEHMKSTVNQLSSTVLNLREENETLRSQSPLSKASHGDHSHVYHSSNFPHSTHRSSSPFYGSPSHSATNGDCSGSPRHSESQQSATSLRHHRPYSMFESRGLQNHCSQRSSHGSFSSSSDSHGLTKYPYLTYDNMPSEHISENSSLAKGLPSQEEVVMKTEVITKKIQELLLSAQDSHHEFFVPCSEQINTAVKEMADLFPKAGCPSEMWNAIRQLSVSASRLNSECRNHMASQMHLLDPGLVTQQVIQCAYDIAKAAKALVTHFQ